MKRVSIGLAVLFALAAAPASAHVGVGAVNTFTAGVMHPLSGLDHLLVAFAVGLWAAMSGTSRAFVLPAVFVGVMTVAAVAGASGLGFTSPEPIIAGTVIVLGGLIALAARTPLVLGIALIAAFAAVHGHTHGTEGGAAVAYIAGLVVATGVLHATGMAAGLLARSSGYAVAARTAGAAIAATGVYLLVA
jgi:urease accessory protein